MTYIFVVYREQDERRSTAACTRLNDMRVDQDMNRTDQSFIEGLDWISTLFLQHNQGVSYHNTLLRTRKRTKLYHRHTRTIVCTCTSYFLVPVRTKATSCQMLPPLHDVSVVSAHMIILIVLLTLVLSLRGVTDQRAPCDDTPLGRHTRLDF